jgi:tight adherence protein C
MTGNLVFALGALFVAVAVMVGALASMLLGRYAPARRRLQEIALVAPAGVVAQDVRLTDPTGGISARLATLVPRSPRDSGRLRKRLARAGYQGAPPLAVYSLSELFTPFLFGGGVVLMWGWSGSVLFFAAVAAIAGYMLPGLVLQRLITLRQKHIRNGLADAVDLLIVCVEAGSSLDQAVVKASEELRLSYPALAEELQYVNTEVRAGKPRLEAFRNFAERTKVDEVRALVAMMVQTDRFGTSIAQALRTFADAMRVKRRQNAEERAGKLGVKLVIPLVFCLFPALYVVILGPAAITILRNLIQQLGR